MENSNPATGGDKTALLRELKIDRSAPPEQQSHAGKWVVGIVVVGALMAGVYFFYGPILLNEDTDAIAEGEDAPGMARVAEGADAQTSRQPEATPASVARGGTASSSVETSRVIERDSSVLDATGYVVARRQATVSSKATGKVSEVLIEEGAFVEKGQLLARLDDSIPRAQYELSKSQLDSARAALAETKVAFKQARLDLQRTQNLQRRNLASKASLDQDTLTVQALIARIEKTQREIEVAQRMLGVQEVFLEDMKIYAPFSGIIIAKAAQEGEMISPVSAGGGFTRTGICTIVDMDSLEVEVDVNESYINRVFTKQPVRVTLNAYPTDHYDAEVIAVIPAADRNKATVRVRVGLVDRDARVLPDMGVRVAFLRGNS